MRARPAHPLDVTWQSVTGQVVVRSAVRHLSFCVGTHKPAGLNVVQEVLSSPEEERENRGSAICGLIG